MVVVAIVVDGVGLGLKVVGLTKAGLGEGVADGESRSSDGWLLW